MLLGHVAIGLLLLAGPVVFGLILGKLTIEIKLLSGIAVAFAASVLLIKAIFPTPAEGSGGSLTLGVLLFMVFGLAAIFWIVATSHAVGTVIFRWRALHARSFVPLAIYLVLPLVVRAVRETGISLSTHRDDVLIENFSKHETELRELAQMFTEDEFVSWLCPDGSGLWRNEAAKPSPERVSRYQALFEAAGARGMAGGRPSLLQDVMRGRRTEIEELNGYVVAEGKRLGVKTPFNEAVVREVLRHGVGTLTPAPEDRVRLAEMRPGR